MEIDAEKLAILIQQEAISINEGAHMETNFAIGTCEGLQVQIVITMDTDIMIDDVPEHEICITDEDAVCDVSPILEKIKPVREQNKNDPDSEFTYAQPIDWVTPTDDMIAKHGRLACEVRDHGNWAPDVIFGIGSHGMFYCKSRSYLCCRIDSRLLDVKK